MTTEERARDALITETDLSLDHIDEALAALTAAGLAIIDTRTHVAVASEPSEADVERVAQALCARQLYASAWGTLREGAQDSYRRDARAAIAAMTEEKP